MKNIRRRICWGVAAALIVALAIWLAVEYSPRDFRSITGLKTDEIAYIWTSGGEDRTAYAEEDIQALLDFFNGYRYQRVSKDSFNFSEEYPDGLNTFNIFIYPDRGDWTYLNPMSGWINIDNNLYRVTDGPLDMEFLQAWRVALPVYQSAEEGVEPLPVANNVSFRAGTEPDGELLLSGELFAGCYLEQSDGQLEQVQITLLLTEEGAAELERISSERVGETVSLWAGGQLLTSPRILGPIEGGKCSFNLPAGQAESALLLLTASDE